LKQAVVFQAETFFEFYRLSISEKPDIVMSGFGKRSSFLERKEAKEQNAKALFFS
jgi:hypothetical protein